MRGSPIPVLQREDHPVAGFDAVCRRKLRRQLARHPIDPNALPEAIGGGQRPLVLRKDILTLRWTRLAGQGARVGAYDHALDAGRRIEGLRRLACQGAGHHIVPDRHGAGRARHTLHRRVVGVPHPDAHRQIRGVTHRPGVTVVVSGAGLHRRWAVRQTHQTGNAAERRFTRLGIRQNRRDEVDMLRIERLLRRFGRHRRSIGQRRRAIRDRLGRSPAPDQAAIRAQHARDRAGRHTNATVRQCGVRAGHLQQRDVAAAQRQRKTVVIPGERGDPRPPRHILQTIQANVFQRLHGGNVVRVRQGRPHRDQAVLFDILVAAAVIVGDIGRFIGSIRKLRANIHQHGCGRPVSRRFNCAHF